MHPIGSNIVLASGSDSRKHCIIVCTVYLKLTMAQNFLFLQLLKRQLNGCIKKALQENFPEEMPGCCQSKKADG